MMKQEIQNRQGIKLLSEYRKEKVREREKISMAYQIYRLLFPVIANGSLFYKYYEYNYALDVHVHACC